jgi:hypothetical protein
MRLTSPFIAGLVAAFAEPFHGWFYLIPTLVNQWLWPDGEAAMLGLAMVTFTVQYLALFALIAASARLIKLAKDFAGPRRSIKLVPISSRCGYFCQSFRQISKYPK